MLIGLAAVCWTLWISRNDLVFQKSYHKSILQVIFRATFWIRSWSILSKHDGRNVLKDGCRALEAAALEIFRSLGGMLLSVLETNLLWDVTGVLGLLYCFM
jgi:hypothetical protein